MLTLEQGILNLKHTHKLTDEQIQQIFKNIFGEQSSVLAMLIYAVVVTIIAVLVTMWIGKLAQNSEKNEQ